MKDKIENFIGYAVIIFIYFLAVVFGFDRVKNLGYCLLRKFEDKPCDECQKTNVFRSGEL